MAGGLGTRMKSATPKHFHPILGRRMVDWIIETGRETGAEPIVVVASPATRGAFEEIGVEIAVQETPLRTAALLRALVDTHHREHADATILSAEPADPRLYGRVVRAADGSVRKVVEGTDATPDEQRIVEIN